MAQARLETSDLPSIRRDVRAGFIANGSLHILQAQGIVASDFFTVETAWLKTLCVFFIHIGTRRVLLVKATAAPNSDWVAQQARNLIIEQPAGPSLLLRDRDTKYSAGFDEIFRTEGAEIFTSPVRAPNANAHAGRWVRTIGQECLDHILIISRRHLEAVLAEFAMHYNRGRPHRGLHHSIIGAMAERRARQGHAQEANQRHPLEPA